MVDVQQSMEMVFEVLVSYEGHTQLDLDDFVLLARVVPGCRR
jgi:hypothetical protein